MPKRLLLLLLLPCALAFAGPIREGNKLYEKGDYPAALEKYVSARATEKDSALVRFNIGTALYKSGKYAESIQELSPLIGATDSTLSAKAAYNAASAHFALGKEQQGGERIGAWQAALAKLQRALDFQPNYTAAKKNAEVITRLLKQEADKQKNQKKDGEDGKQPPLSEAAKKARDLALALARQGKYQQALQVLQKALEAEPSATALQPYQNRIQDVIDIEAGRTPAKAPDASNALNELELI